MPAWVINTPLLEYGIVHAGIYWQIRDLLLANSHMWRIMFLLRAVVYMLVRKVSPRGPVCFRCLMLRLSGPTELLFLLCCIAYWTWVVVRVMVCLCSL